MALCLVGAIAAALRRRPSRGPCLSVAFIVPARDEAAMIGEDDRGDRRRRRRYPGEVEAIVIENGSADGTARAASGGLRGLRACARRLVECPPLGKSRALNVGLAQAEAEVVVRIDADTLVTPSSWPGRFPISGIRASAASAPCRCRGRAHGWIAHMRAIETYYGAAFKRIAQNVADCVTVLPGATVAYRR